MWWSSKPKQPKKTGGKEGSKGVKPLPTVFRLSSTTYFLTYKGISDTGEKLSKESLSSFLLNNPRDDPRLKPVKYLICQQMYDSGQPHFHAVLIYPKRKEIKSQEYYDYLGIHPNIQTMRNMKAALEYVYKEDPHPVTNMDIVQERRVARARDSSSLYQFLHQQMLKDPFNFDPIKYCNQHNLTKQIYKANYTKALQLLKLVRQAYCNKLLFQKPCFKLIDRALIEEKLSPSELITYDSWSGYQTIVSYLNQIPTYGHRRPMKTLNLLITGSPGIGKTSLFHNPFHRDCQSAVEDYCSVYPMGMSTWFPAYKSGVYGLILWNEARLTSYSYDTILKLLEGSHFDLPVKGGSAPKRDNPLIVMTSNMTLEQMIQHKFGYSKRYQEMARGNLSVRVQNVVVPPGYDLFLLQKLLVPFSS